MRNAPLQHVAENSSGDEQELLKGGERRYAPLARSAFLGSSPPAQRMKIARAAGRIAFPPACTTEPDAARPPAGRHATRYGVIASNFQRSVASPVPAVTDPPGAESVQERLTPPAVAFAFP